jgi:hypothetical protein
VEKTFLDQKFGQHFFDGERVDVRVKCGDGCQCFGGEQPYGAGVPSIDSLEQDIDISIRRFDDSDQVLIGPGGKRKRSVGPVADFVQAGWKATVQYGKQLLP